MNDHSKDSQTRYFREAAIVLAKEGFQLDEVHTDRLCMDCLWGELYSAINSNQWSNAITQEQADYLRAKYLF